MAWPWGRECGLDGRMERENGAGTASCDEIVWLCQPQSEVQSKAAFDAQARTRVRDQSASLDRER